MSSSSLPPPRINGSAVRRPSAAKVHLSSRSHIECIDCGLFSVQGAQEIIAMISARRLVTKLILGHNELSDDGCQVLFKFLGSEQGKKHPIAEISLNSNAIGDRGLLAISEYLTDNQSLKELFLQNNHFHGDSSVISTFTAALNTSHLETLSLVTNHALSDPFIAAFLPRLDAPHLREMHLSAMHLTPRSAPHLTAFLASPRCRLRTLKCNGNALGLRAIKGIIRTITRANFRILVVELHSNHLAGGGGAPSGSDATSEGEGGDGAGGPDVWKIHEAALRVTLLRNERLRRATEKDALQLLRHARPVLLPPKSPRAQGKSPASCTDACACASPTHPDAAALRLPPELKLHILSFLAPTLSPAQRIRVCAHAAAPATLPRLLPRLSSVRGGGGCLPDPASLPFGPVWGAGSGGGGGCANGKCMGAGNSVLCHREEERMKWLAAVGCDAFELEGASSVIGSKTGSTL